MRRLLLLALLAVMNPAYSQQEAEEAWEAECRDLEKVEYPAADQPSPAQLIALKSCDVEDLYYGLRGAVDYVKARHCAFAQQHEPVLMQIYGNGHGVQRNYRLARKAACKVHYAESRLHTLTQMERGVEGFGSIHYCDDMSRAIIHHCHGMSRTMNATERLRQYDLLSAKWSRKGQQALRSLVKSAETFMEASHDKEVALFGMELTQEVGDEMDALYASFLNSVKNCAAGTLPKYSAKDFADADQSLNVLYRRLQTWPEPEPEISPESFRIAQRAWLDYRNKWVQFVRVKCSAVSDDSAKAYVTMARNEKLRAILATWEGLPAPAN